MLRLSKQKIVLLLLGLIILLTIPLALYFYSKTQKVSVINNSKYFQVSYKDTPYFTSLLKEWNVFGKYRIKMSDYSPFFTVKSIQIVLTDIKQARLQTYAENNPNNLLASFGARVTGDHILIIRIYLNPSLSKDLETDTNPMRTIAINNLFYSGVISTLYDVTHNEEKEIKDGHIRDEIRKTTYTDKSNPFIIESKNSK